LRRWVNVSIEGGEWLAVRPEQIDALGLESKPQPAAKQTMGDSKDAAQRTVQAEAINPPDLRRMVRGFVSRHIDAAAYRRIREQERDERREAVESLSSFNAG
jgi:hypothetical protein